MFGCSGFMFGIFQAYVGCAGVQVYDASTGNLRMDSPKKNIQVNSPIGCRLVEVWQFNPRVLFFLGCT